MDISFATSPSLFDAALTVDSSGTSSSTASATPTGFPVFPNGQYISKFYVINPDPGLTHLDIDLYNECYLPRRPLPYANQKRSPQNTGPPRPDYLSDEPPCKRQGAMNTNCYIQNINGTFPGLQVSEKWQDQQHCFCTTYPFFDSASGCQKCFEEHGGIEGYHWFPQDYIDPVSSLYCAAAPPKTGLYPFVQHWASTNAAANVPGTTASNALGTRTAASLYYTAASTLSSSKGGSATSERVNRSLLEVVSFVTVIYLIS
ncbi:Hypothetical protein R9X50_00522700 [Acrodontium crateriforme]|uniref:Uncharacterized protein n=1 Tax=Acrodontium crateriforme TaxID=150365 RepID=A0AAQ3M6R3_9PEZI|nr:Hypothetical protein R9X50_00522700 [Acrodontium crateriforme]